MSEETKISKLEKITNLLLDAAQAQLIADGRISSSITDAYSTFNKELNEQYEINKQLLKNLEQQKT